MKHRIGVVAFGMAALALICVAKLAAADPRMAAGLAGLDRGAAPVEQVRY